MKRSEELREEYAAAEAMPLAELAEMYYFDVENGEEARADVLEYLCEEISAAEELEFEEEEEELPDDCHVAFASRAEAEAMFWGGAI